MHPCSDDAFGPTSCARPFDFTLTFEQTILSILPTSVLILAAPLRLLFLIKREPRTQGLAPRFAGIITVALASIGLQLALVIAWSSSSVTQPPTGLPSTALSLFASTALLCLSYFELRKGSRPPILSSVYLLASIIFDAPQISTLWTTQKTRLATLQTAGTALRVVWLAVESQSKTANLKQPFKDHPPEATSGVFALSLIWWLNDLFKKGFRNLLSTKDLFSLHPKLPSRRLGQVLQVAWQKHAAQPKPLALPMAIIDSLRLDLLIAIIPRLLMTGFSFAQPFLITSALTLVEERHSIANERYGYGLIGATFLIYVGIALSTVYFKQCLSRTITKFRGSIVYLIYHETLDMKDSALTESAALTHMSTDVDNIIEFLENIYNAWACTLEVAIGTWLLERQLGASCVVPVLVVLICAAGQSLVAKKIGKDQQSWNQAIQARVSNVSNILGAIKAIKMSGQARLVREKLRTERQQELDTSKPFFMGILWLNILAGLPAIWSPVITFIVFAVQATIRGQQSLSTVQAFTSLSIITLVTSPASKLLALLPQIAAAGGCFTRIQNYLLNPKRPTSVTSAPSSAPVHNPESTGAQLQDSADLDSTAIKFNEATICAAPPDGGVQRTTINRAIFTIPKGSITIVLGPTGSGKTTLLRSIIKELECVSGSVDVRVKRISLCSQTPFIFYGTIKENICGLSTQQDFDEAWYRLVIHACDLDLDLQNWSGGDETFVGSKGLKLSGGQRQRLALARALYARNQLVLLDDILSALDNKTQETICQRVLSSDGILRKLKSTVVMTTHSYRNIQFADQVVVLDRNGAAHVHRPDEHSLTSQVMTSLPTDDLLEKDDRHTKDSVAQLMQKASTNSSADDDKLMDLTRRTGDLKLYSYYAHTIGWPLVIGFLFTAAAASFTENFPQVWLLWWAAANGSQLSKYMPVYVVLALAATLSISASIWIMFLRIMPKSAQRLYEQLVQSVFGAPLSFFISTDSGITLNRFSQDMSMVTLALPIALLGFALACFDCIAKMGLIATGSLYVAISIPFTLLALFVLQHVYLRTSRQLRFLDLESKSPLYGHFTETLEGLVTIRAFEWQREALDKHIHNLDHSQQPYYLLLCIQRWLSLVLDLMVTALAVLVVALAVNLRFATNAGLLGVALNNILSFNQSLASVVTSWTSLETSLGAIARVKTFRATTPSENDPDRDQKPPSDWPSQGTIDVRDMSVTYADNGRVLDQVQMRIQGGEKIGICGRTGSGKSTLILALLRLVDCSSGSITIDGIDIKHLQPDELRQQIITVPQDSFILTGTVRSNLDPHGTASDAEIISALQKFRIWTVLEARGGLEGTLLDQPLSEGEQQLLWLARTVLRKSKVVILDEATSSVDGETDRVVQEMLMEAFADSTVINVAHRINTILHYDKIAVLDGGRLVEFDTPERLLAYDSAFKRLYDRSG